MPKLALCLVIAEIGGGGGMVDPGYGVEAPVDPGYGIPGLPGFGGGRPDNTLPGGGGHPWLPGHGRPPRPDQGLPGGGGHPGNWVPGSGLPPLPTHPIYRPDKPSPPGTSPGAGAWVIAYIPGHGFKWVAVVPGVPEKPQPPTVPTTPTDPAAPDNSLPTVPVDPTAPAPKPA